MARIIVNDQYIDGDNIVISKNIIKVDDIDYTFEVDNLGIQIIGDVKSLQVTACNNMNIEGNAGEVNTMSGDVTIKGNVLTGVKTQSGDVNVTGDIKNNVKTMSGDVKATMIMGNASSMSGDVRV